MKLQPWVILGTLVTTIAATGTDTFDSAQPGSPPTSGLNIRGSSWLSD
jgi:hypothetical protein